MTTWNIGGGLTCVSLGLMSVEPSGFSAMYCSRKRGSLSGWNGLWLIWPSGRRFSRPFNPLGANFHRPAPLRRPRAGAIDTPGEGRVKSALEFGVKDSASPFDEWGLDPNDLRDSTRLTRGKQSHGNRNCEVVQ